jgi:rare lipoprotein A
MNVRVRRLAAAALPLLLGACAGVAPRPDGAAAPAHVADAHSLASDAVVVPHHALDVPPPAFEPDGFAVPVDPPGDDAAPVSGHVSWYGKRFAGRRTASGERFDPKALTMAHRQLPFGTRVRVTNPENGRSVVVRVNDRGPFVRARVADLSHAAARELDMLHDGVILAHLEVLVPSEPPHGGAPTELASSK